MASLYNLTGDMLELMNMLEDPDTDSQVIEDTLEGVQFELEKKAESYVQVIRQFESDAAAYKAEKERLEQRQAICENNAKRLKTALLKAMQVMGKDKLDAGLFTLKIANNGGKKPLVIDGVVPDRFLKIKYENDNERIREYLENLPEGEVCDFAHLAERGQHLNIK